MLHIGIDMHGTLIDDLTERVPDHLVDILTAAINKLHETGKGKVFLCTGNDLTFVQRKIDPEMLELFDGHILEMGCVYSDGVTESVLVPPEVASDMRGLEEKLKGIDLPEAYKFDRRLAIISIFTRHGIKPETMLPRIEQALKEFGYDGLVKAVCSSVAVDICPIGFSKITGMREVANGMPVMGIADSMNDLELVMGADQAVVPSNARQELIEHIKISNNPKIKISKKECTEAVIEALERVAEG